MNLEDLDSHIFGRMPNGELAYLFTLQNDNGVKIQITNYGARIVSALTPDKYGNLDNVILGYECFEHYLSGHAYLGATIGRVANKIKEAKFELEGQTYLLSKNLGNHHLHGGKTGFESILWNIVDYSENKNSFVEFQVISQDGDQGYPGNLTAKVKYTLLPDNSIEIKMSALTDKTTIVNLSNHAYFNLNSKNAVDIFNHKFKFRCTQYLESSEKSVPTGNILSVENTLFDFGEFDEIGLRIKQNNESIIRCGGYDHFLISPNYEKGKLNLMAEIIDPESGRILHVSSTLPGIQFYTANFFDSIHLTTNGKVCKNHSAFCIEPAHYVDAPNHPNFPSIVLKVGELYDEIIVYKFSTI